MCLLADFFEHRKTAGPKSFEERDLRLDDSHSTGSGIHYSLGERFHSANVISQSPLLQERSVRVNANAQLSMRGKGLG
jgi:hypothetical protein